MRQEQLRKMVQIALIAAVYAVWTVGISPVAYGPIQFRMSEMMKALALRDRQYVSGLALGLLVANMFSPFAGPWELLVMPLACYLGGLVAYSLRKKPVLALLLYSAWISFWVSMVLAFAAGIPFRMSIGPIFLSEAVLFQIGRPLCNVLLRVRGSK